MTPQLQQAIKLLQLNRLELAATIQQEMEENVTLDEANPELEKDVNDISSEAEIEEPKVEEPEKISEIKLDEDIQPEVDWSNYLDEFNSTGKVHFETEVKAATNFEAFTASKTNLAVYCK